jgi:DNA-binding LytR/AlgR family response regulator
MQVRVETTGPDQPEEIVIRCKSVTPEVESLARQLQAKDKGKAVISFFKGDEQYFIGLREILFFETDNERLFAHVLEDTFEVKSRLYEVEAILPGYFVRVSRSTIINTLAVRSIQKGLTGVSKIAFLKSRKEVYGSRHYYPLLIHKMEERVIDETE